MRPEAAVNPIGTRFHISDFSLISGSPGDKASTGENWETRKKTRLGRSRAGLLRSPRDLHFVFATFGALPSLRNFDDDVTYDDVT